MSTTYINSKVSLISKSMIRYEGTLFSINAEEATITLSNVKSFGTETRKADKFIPPRDAIFEYIIFKATDIKDLIVDEPLVNEFNDPAILQAHTSLSTNAAAVSNENKSLSLNGINGQSNVFNGNQTSNQLTNVQSAGQTDRFGFRSRVSTPSSSQARSPVSEVSSQQQQQQQQQQQKSKSDKQLTSKASQNNTNSNFNRNNNANINTSNNLNRRKLDNQSDFNHNHNNQRFDGRQNRPYLNNHNFNTSNNRRQMNCYPNNNNNKYASNNNNNNNNNRFAHNFHRNEDLNRFGNNNNLANRNGLRKSRTFNNNTNNSNHNNNHNNNNTNNKGGRKFGLKLKTEFDFEKANQVFQQMVDKLGDLDITCNGEKTEKTSNEDSNEGKTTLLNKEENNFYDKRKSFFDNISCEAIERSKGKKNHFDWKQERKLNAETFGLQLNYRRTDFNQGFRNRINYRNNRKFTSGNIRQPRTNSS